MEDGLSNGEKNTLVVRRPCGCWVMMAIIDEKTEAEDRKRYASEATEILVDIPGSTSQMVAVEEARAGRSSCPDCDAIKEQATVEVNKAQEMLAL